MAKKKTEKKTGNPHNAREHLGTLTDKGRELAKTINAIMETVFTIQKRNPRMWCIKQIG